MSSNKDLSLEFVQFALESEVLRFGSFLTKAGRTSPYFFNAGLFNTGKKVSRLAEYYAKTLLASNISYDMLFGPAYKGIPLVTSITMQIDAITDKETPYAFNRKEQKDHGEGGNIVGAPLKGKVIIVDDVISAGTSIRESVELIRNAGATPVAVLIALDRQEKTGAQNHLSELSAVESVEKEFSIPVISICKLQSILSYLEISGSASYTDSLSQIKKYREQYGI